MTIPAPLVIRRSLTNGNFLFQTGVSVALLGYAYALFARWPDVASDSASRDYFLACLLALGGGISFVFLTVRALLDRDPLLQVDGSGIRARDAGNLTVPLREISGCRFEQITEGRSSYWYFFFTQTDAATGLKCVYKISADEFDPDNDEVLALIEELQAADKPRAPQGRLRPKAIGTDLQGDTLQLGYSRAKELRTILIYWVVAAFTAAFAVSIALAVKDKLTLLPEFFFELLSSELTANIFVQSLWVAVFVMAASGSSLRLRDAFLRPHALRFARGGISGPALGERLIPWPEIKGLSFEPAETLKITLMNDGYPVEKFVPVSLMNLPLQEIYEALCWLLVRLRIKFSQPWDVAPETIRS